MKNKLINIIIIIVLTLVVLYFSLKDNYNEIITLLLNADIRWLFIGYLFVLSYTFFKTIITNDIINKFRTYGFIKTFSLQIMTFFFNAVTPFSSGGQPFQIYVLKKNNVPISDGTNIIMQESIIHQIAVIIVGLITLTLNQFFKVCDVKGIILTFLAIGFLINILVLGLLFLISYSKKINKSLIKWFINLLTVLRLVKNKQQLLSKLNKTIENFTNNSKILLKDKKRFVKLVGINCIALFCLYIVPLTILFSFGDYNSFDGMTAIILVSFVSIISSYIPLPGGMGGQEYLFVLLFGLYVNQPLLSSLMLLWRFITYYLPMIIGAIIFHIKQKEI